MSIYTNDIEGKNYAIAFYLNNDFFVVPYQQDLTIPQPESDSGEDTIKWKPEFKGDIAKYIVSDAESKTYKMSFSCFYNPHNKYFQFIRKACLNNEEVYFKIVDTKKTEDEEEYNIFFGSCTMNSEVALPLENQATISIECTVQGILHEIGINEKCKIRYEVGSKGAEDQDEEIEAKFGEITPKYSKGEPVGKEGYKFKAWSKDGVKEGVDEIVLSDVTYKAIFIKE